jgi:cation transport ATPase
MGYRSPVTDLTGSDQERSDQQQRDEEADRRLNELLQEIRVVLPGTTVLFGFLLAVTGFPNFPDFTRANRAMYFVAFTCAAVALVFLLAEASYHRLRGRPYDKYVMLRTVSRQAITAMTFLAISLTAAFALVVDLTYGERASAIATSALVLLVLTVWFGLPLSRRATKDGDGTIR